MLRHPVKVNVLDVLRNVNLYSRLYNCIYAINGQTNKRNCTNFESNLARMVIFYLPVKFELDWRKCFRVRVRKRKCWKDKQTDKQTDGITPISKGT